MAIAVGSCFFLKSLWLTIPVEILIFGSLSPFTRSTDIPVSNWLQLNIKCGIGILPVHRLEACSTI